MTPTLRIKRLTMSATIPRYQSAGAAGLDLHADFGGAGVRHLEPDEWHAINTGIAVEIPPGFEGQVRGRSGLAFRQRVEFFVGTIDADFRGEVMVALKPDGLAPLTLAHGDRIAQLVIAPVARCEVIEAEQLSETARGAAGFGHTGSR